MTSEIHENLVQRLDVSIPRLSEMAKRESHLLNDSLAPKR